jgi:hypothetical protein|tara:strand:- start:14192 stop:14635 length:444 start_codon:yes stop_codon:yes gene_type:complete
MNENIFEPGDLIAVFGGEIGKEGNYADRVSICRVIVCGQKDLIVEDDSGKSYSRNSHHLVSKNICYKLSMKPENLSKVMPLKPEIGDLVLSYTKDAFRDDPPVEITGILYKIVYKLGRPDKSTLICGTELKEVSHSSLIVLQKNQKE